MNVTRTDRVQFFPATGSAVGWAGVAVGLLFVALGLTKLLPGVAEEVARLGIPPWVRVLVGAAEVAGGVLFCVPRAGASGAGVLGAVLAGAIGAYFALRPHEMPFPFVPMGLLALVGLVTWGRVRLAWWNRYLAVLDRFAAREGPPRRPA